MKYKAFFIIFKGAFISTFFERWESDFKKLFEFVTLGTYILLDGNYYDQIDEVAMFWPFGLVFANLFMGFFEK